MVLTVPGIDISFSPELENAYFWIDVILDGMVNVPRELQLLYAYSLINVSFDGDWNENVASFTQFWNIFVHIEVILFVNVSEVYA